MTSSTEDITLIPASVTVNQAIDKAGCGCGNAFHLIGPYLIIAFDGAEIIIISVVALILECEWNLTTFQVFFVSVASFFGMFAGSITCSGLSDIFGRRPVMVGNGIGIVLSGMVSALATGFIMFVICRFALGFFIGATLGSASAYMVELTPTKMRVVVIAGKTIAWAVGSIVSLLLALVLLPVYSWRVLIMACTLVFTPALVALYCAGESPRFDVNMGRTESAGRTLDRLYKFNRIKTTAPISTSLKYGNSTSDDGNDKECVSIYTMVRQGTHLRDIVLFVLFSFCILGIYYGYSFAVPRMLNEDFCPVSHPLIPQNNTTQDLIPICHPLSYESLKLLAITTALSPIGPIIAAISAEWIGRRKTTYLAALLLLIFNSLLYTCISRTVLVIVLTIARAISKGMNMLSILLPCEYFPTSFRGFAVSMSVFGGRCGAILSIFMSQYGYNASPKFVIGYIHVLCALIVVLIFCLKKETKGLELEDH